MCVVSVALAPPEISAAFEIANFPTVQQANKVMTFGLHSHYIHFYYLVKCSFLLIQKNHLYTILDAVLICHEPHRNIDLSQKHAIGSCNFAMQGWLGGTKEQSNVFTLFCVLRAIQCRKIWRSSNASQQIFMDKVGGISFYKFHTMSLHNRAMTITPAT